MLELKKKIRVIFLDFFSLTQAGEITYTNTNTPRVGEGIVEFGSRLVTIIKSGIQQTRN